MKNNFIKILCSISLVFISAYGLSSLVYAETTPITGNMPRQGYVEMNEKGKVTNASSPILKKNNSKPSSTDLLFGVSKEVFGVSRTGFWTYYVDHVNYFNGYKWSHSNFRDTANYHYASAKVGNSKLVRVYAQPGQLACATAKGYGTAYAYYGW